MFFGFHGVQSFFGPSYPPSSASHLSFAMWGTAILSEWLSPSHICTLCCRPWKGIRYMSGDQTHPIQLQKQPYIATVFSPFIWETNWDAEVEETECRKLSMPVPALDPFHYINMII